MADRKAVERKTLGAKIFERKALDWEVVGRLWFGRLAVGRLETTVRA